jgi:PelA/Pel-15E family pectate lyase
MLALLLVVPVAGSRVYPAADVAGFVTQVESRSAGTMQQALDPEPADGARSVDPANAMLRWVPGHNAITHRLFFGRTDPPSFREEMKRVQYQPGLLMPGTSYWWRVDELTPSGIVIGRIWRFTTAGVPDPALEAPVTWSQCLNQPPAWYATPEAVRIAEIMLLYQRNTGGWPKNIDMSVPLKPDGRARVASEKTLTDSTIDNDSTTTQIRFLARVFEAAKQDRFRTAILAGVRYLLEAQYGNGGWPQYYPLRNDYSRQITFNDDAIVHVMELLQDIAAGRPPFAWIDPPIRSRAAPAVELGVKMILAAQIRTKGTLTAWCAQHDAISRLPCAARSYELPSVSGRESIGIVRFLMEIVQPSPEVVRAIESAVSWFRASAIRGWRLDKVSDASKPRGFDYVLVADPSAPLLWARFYDIRTNRPMFVGRDGIVKPQLSDIEYERRTGYTYLGPFAAGLLQTDYPAWRKRLGLVPGIGKTSCYSGVWRDVRPGEKPLYEDRILRLTSGEQPCVVLGLLCPHWRGLRAYADPIPAERRQTRSKNQPANSDGRSLFPFRTGMASCSGLAISQDPKIW